MISTSIKLFLTDSVRTNNNQDEPGDECKVFMYLYIYIYKCIYLFNITA